MTVLTTAGGKTWIQYLYVTTRSPSSGSMDAGGGNGSRRSVACIAKSFPAKCSTRPTWQTSNGSSRHGVCRHCRWSRSRACRNSRRCSMPPALSSFSQRPFSSATFGLSAPGRKELIRWVLSWMPDVRVLAPKSLHERIVEKLRDGLRAQE